MSLPAILCADDDRNLAQIVEKSLSGQGYRVLLAHDGEEALALVEREAPAVILANLMLPGASGFGLLEAVRRLPRPLCKTPVLLTSSCRISPAERDRAKALRAQALLLKPIPLAKLEGLVAKYAKPGPPPVATGGKGETATQRAAVPADAEHAPLTGSLAEQPLPELLHHLHGLRTSGVLTLAHGKKRKAIQLRDGHPVAVKSNLVNECLGNMMVSQGVISKGELDESLRRMKRGEGLQGEILVAMQLMEEEQLAEALRSQASQKLFEAFSWSGGRYRFEMGRRIERVASLALDTSPASLILRGAERMPRERLIAFVERNGARFVVRGESPFYRFQEVELPPDAEPWLQALDGARSLAELVSERVDLLPTLYGLLVTELLELRDGPGVSSSVGRVGKAPARSPGEDRELRAELAATAERMRQSSYFEIFSVAENAGEQAVQAAYERLSEKLHPDRFAGASDAVQQLAEEVRTHVERACETLVDPRRRLEYETELRRGEQKAAQKAEGRRALEAETAFQKGEAFMRQRSYEAALARFGESIERNPEEGEYHAHYGWCLHLCHPDSEAMAMEAIEHVRRGIKLARDREKPYLYLGRLYKAVGRAAAAEKMFTRAVQIRPDCVEAVRELRLIHSRRQKSKGLIGRILRR